MLLLHDSFTGADGTAIGSHTPDYDYVGGGWIASAIDSSRTLTGNQWLQGGKFVIDSVWGGAYIDIGVSKNFRISFDWTTGTGDTRGVIQFRRQDGSNHIYYNFRTPIEDDVVLYTRIADAQTSIWEKNGAGIAYSTTYRLTVNVWGDASEFFIDGVKYMFGRHAFLPDATLILLGAGGQVSTGMVYDNIVVETLEPTLQNVAVLGGVA